jgi:hypothetical protein
VVIAGELREFFRCVEAKQQNNSKNKSKSKSKSEGESRMLDWR